jgi:hypothetical protein
VRFPSTLSTNVGFADDAGRSFVRSILLASRFKMRAIVSGTTDYTTWVADLLPDFSGTYVASGTNIVTGSVVVAAVWHGPYTY